MKLVFFGTGPFGAPTLEVLASSRHKISAVVTSADKPRGRGLSPSPSPIKALAGKLGLETTECGAHVSDLAPSLDKKKADVFVVVDFGHLLPKAVLSLPRLFSLNVHASLLPKYRGAAPIQRALMAGDKETGVSVIRLTEKLDAGDVLSQKKTEIARCDAETLHAKLAALGAQALMDSLDAVEAGHVVWTPQDETKVTLAKKISKEEAKLDWDSTPARVVGTVRALKNWPTAHFFYEGRRILALDARESSLPAGKAGPGTVLKASPAEGLIVAARGGAVELLTLQLEGRKPLPSREFLNGFRLEPGRALE